MGPFPHPANRPTPPTEKPRRSYKSGRVILTMVAVAYFGSAVAVGLAIVVYYAAFGEFPPFVEGLL